MRQNLSDRFKNLCGKSGRKKLARNRKKRALTAEEEAEKKVMITPAVYYDVGQQQLNHQT